MGTKRKMPGADRRKSILDAARPLFAKRGFSATNMRGLAKAANVSEALIYRHFKDKKELYSAVLDYSPAFSRISVREISKIQKKWGSTEAIVTTVYVLVKHALITVPGRDEFNRLFLFSLLEDATFAKKGLRARKAEWSALWSEWCEEAGKAGDLVPMPGSDWNRWLFFLCIEVMLVCIHLSKGKVFEYQKKKDLTEEFVTYCLRGIGVKDAVINKHLKQNRIEAHFRQIIHALPHPYE